ncbi:MAG: replication-associated recombination protein A [Minisyncoccia bacterium]
MNVEPLASKVRPQSLDAFVGQEHLVGAGKPLREAILGRHLFSFILWGPPGSGKTTLARLYARALDAEFYELSAVDAGKDDIKKLLAASGERGARPHTAALLAEKPKPLVLFIDEIHRFNKAQQDFLLPFVEQGRITLIGATTENPSFEVIPALLSRCRVFVLSELSDADMEKIISRAAKELNVTLPKGARDWLVQLAQGDARQALGVLENAKTFYEKISLETLRETVQSHHLRYDKKGEEHYNTISAFIKTMRAGQADAALYYLARMVDAGEDPLFIARRMVVFASEDVGFATPTALVVANAVFRACETVGYPECAINLAHGAAYLAQCKKSRASYDAYFEALADVQKFGNLPIPMNIRNAPTKLMKDLGYHKNYQMYDEKSYLPEKLKNKKYLK